MCLPADPEAKGLVERFHDYLDRSFLPGRAFVSPADFNAQLGEWTAKANTRWHRRLKGFEVAVVRDATAAARVAAGDGYLAAVTNYSFLAHAVWMTEEAVSHIRGDD